MSAVEIYIDEAEEPARSIMIYFHEVFINELGLRPKIRYNIPFYDSKTWICYLNPRKDNSVELAFIRGNELSNMQGLLKPNGRKQIMGVNYTSLKDIHYESLMEVLLEAIELDASTPNKSKRKSKE